jgi:hypothetical protein
VVFYFLAAVTSSIVVVGVAGRIHPCKVPEQLCMAYGWFSMVSAFALPIWALVFLRAYPGFRMAAFLIFFYVWIAMALLYPAVP